MITILFIETGRIKTYPKDRIELKPNDREGLYTVEIDGKDHTVQVVM